MNTKKMSSKAAAIILTFAAAASMSAVSAGAADYGNGAEPSSPSPDQSAYNTGYPDGSGSGSQVTDNSSGGSGSTSSATSSEGSGTGTDTGSSGSTAASSAEDKKDNSAAEAAAPVILTSESVTSAIEDAISSGEETATIQMSANSSGSVVIQEDTLAAIAASDVIVTVDVAAKGNNMSYSVDIDPSMITDVDGSVNIGFSIEKTDKMETVDGGAYVPTDAVVITPAGSGDFGVTLQVTLPPKALKGMKKSKVKLYSVAKNGTVTLVDDDSFVINDDGSVTILISNGDSQLVISDKDLVKANEKAKKLKEESGSTSKKSKSTKSSKAKSAAALGTADLAALSAAGIITQKKKKKK